MEKRIPILEGKEVAVGYKMGKNFNLVAEGINFSLPAGKLTCLMGPNGVGKSTLIKAIMGQIYPVHGEIYYQNTPIRKFNTKDLAKKISVVLTDRISSGNLTVHQLVALGRIPFTNWLGTLSEQDENAVEQAIQATKIGYLRDKRISEISDGQLQKVMVARALAQNGDLLILDEPTAHLDLVNRFEIMHLLRSIAKTQQKAILVVTHDLDIAIETADEFWLMPFESPLITGRPEDLILSGKINQLLPTAQLHFSASSGKIQFSAPLAYPQIKGPEEVVQWLKLALRKNGTGLGAQVKITAFKDPVNFRVEKGSVNTNADSIEKVLKLINRSLKP